MFIAIIFTIGGFIFHIWLVATSYIIIRSVFADQIEYYEIRNQLETCMAFKRILPKIQERALALYDRKFHGKYYEKRKIESSLDRHLLSAMKMERCQELLFKIELFKQIPPELLTLIADNTVEVFFSKHDVILRADQERSQVTFLKISTFCF